MTDYSKPLTIEGLHKLYRSFDSTKSNGVMSFTQSFLEYALAFDLGYTAAFNLGAMAVALKVSSDLYNHGETHLLDSNTDDEIIEMLNSFDGLVEFCMESFDDDEQPEPTITLQ